MFTLAKWAYMACSETERQWYDTTLAGRIKIDVRDCCRALVGEPPRDDDGSCWPSLTEGNVVWIAAVNGHVDCLAAFKQRGHSFCVWTCAQAARGGHVDCLRYLRENGAPWSEWTCHLAAAGGHLDCLRYANENGCEWNEKTCQHAAAGGHFDCLRYAHENGCRLDISAYMAAAAGGYLHCLFYASIHRYRNN